MDFENLNLQHLSDTQLKALHEKTSGAVRDRKPIQVEDIKSGMSPEDMQRAQDKISEVLRSLR